MSIDKKNENPIGVFDSGVGGISVLRELVKIMPNENYLYFGDSINAPYGTKEVSVIRELTIKNIEKLLDMGAKSIVVACNTATSAAAFPRSRGCSAAALSALRSQTPAVSVHRRQPGGRLPRFAPLPPHQVW